MANNMTDLRDILFEQLREMKDPAKAVDLDRVRAMNDVAKTLVDTAKVEVDFARVTGADVVSDFIQIGNEKAPKPDLVPAPPNQLGVAGQLVAANVTRHVCK